ncbi:MAG: ABC transporter substrate-binding protein [Bacteroidota bacterium]
MRVRYGASLILMFLLALSSSQFMVYGSEYPELKDEKLVVYIVFQEEEGCRLLDLFEERTGIGYSYLRMPTGEIIDRVISNPASNKVDVILGGSADAHQSLANSGLLEKYVSSVAKEIDPRFKSPQGYWTGIYVGPLAICIDENRWRKEFANRGIKKPETFEDLLNPSFKGKIIMPDPITSGTAYTILASLIQLWGEDKAVNYLKALNKNIGEYTKSGFTVARKVAIGEYLIGIDFVHDQLLMKQAGFNISSTIPPGAGWEIGCVSMVKNCQHPKAAKAFIDFMVGREAGQLHTNLTERISTRKDVAIPQAAKPLLEIPINREYDFFKAARMKNRYQKLWRERVIH